MKRHSLFLLMIVFLFLSCGEEEQPPQYNYYYNDNSDKDYFSPRISVEGISGGLIQFNVQIEGGDGNAVTGASVIVMDLLNRTQRLHFNSEKYSYTGTMQDIKDVNLYSINIESALLDDKMIINVPYLQFTNKPALTVLRDESGSSALSGAGLNGAESIQIAWSTTGVNTVYQAAVRTLAQIVYSVFTEDLTVTIPENTLEAGSYIISITAQKICGDPLFKDYNYYSVSSETGADVAFNVY